MAARASTKRLAISKAQTQMVTIIAVASFIVVFCLMASRAVWGQIGYQTRVTNKAEKAHKQLVSNIQAFEQLKHAYANLNSGSTNAIGGQMNGTGDNDGNNTRVVLDALPQTYDFPALTASIEKILHDQSLSINSISGTDDQLNQEGNTSSPTPQAVPMPFTFSINNASYTAVQQLIVKLQQSIRPIAIDSIDLSGGVNNMTLTVNAHTYYQPAKNVNIAQQVVK